MEERRIAYRFLVENLEVKRQFGKPRRRWQDNFRMELKEMGAEGVDRIRVIQDRDKWRTVVVTVTNFRVSQNAVDFLFS